MQLLTFAPGKPLGFDEASAVKRNPAERKYYNWKSTQSKVHTSSILSGGKNLSTVIQTGAVLKSS